jgi:hypothetical protein
MTPSTIWQCRQNKPTYVVNDLIRYAPARVIYGVLLQRGIFKWLAARRQLIRLKIVWKRRVTYSLEMQRECEWRKREYWRGYRRALEECRAEVRALCHSPRWQAPDNDERARQWLRQMERELRKEEEAA